MSKQNLHYFTFFFSFYSFACNYKTEIQIYSEIKPFIPTSKQAIGKKEKVIRIQELETL